MSKYHDRLERGFEHLAYGICHHPWLTILGMLALTAALAYGIQFIQSDTSNEAFLHKDDPILLAYEDFRDQFGRDDFIIIALKPPKGIFDPDFLLRLKELHNELEDNTPHLDDIISLINARSTEGRGDTLYVDDLMKDWPQGKEQLAAFEKKVMSNPIYRNRLVSKDAEFTTVVLKIDAYASRDDGADPLAGFDDKAVDDALAGFEGDSASKDQQRKLSDEEISMVVSTVRNIMKAREGQGYAYYLAGTPVVSDMLKKSMMRDMMKFMRLVVLIIGLILLVLFRRISGVLMPLFIVGLSVGAAMGCMGWVDIKFTTPLSILPSFLIAVGVGNSVHILVIFFMRLNRGATRTDAIAYALGHSGLAVVMTSLTTAAGLASFAGAKVAPISDLGILSCVGVLISLAYTIVLLPAMLTLSPLKPKKTSKPQGGSMLDRILDGVSEWTTSHPWPVMIGTFVVIGLSLLGIMRLSFSHDVLKWLPERDPVRIATETIDGKMAGTVSMEILLDTGRENGLHDPALLKAIDRLSRELESEPVAGLQVGKAYSLADVLKEINQALNENRPEMNRIPDNPKLIPQELLLFENSGSDDLEDVVDSRFQIARITLNIPWADTLKLVPLVREVEARLKAVIDPKIKFHSTGMISLFGRTLYAAIHSMAQSYGIALVVITCMMILLIGNIRMGLASMLPNLTPILFTLGIMGWLQLPLDMFTMLVASIAIGLAVDDTVHFMHNYRRYYSQTGDVTGSVKQTLHSSGRAMITTTVVLTLGFAVFSLAEMNNLYYFGILISITLALALLALFIIGPALMALIHTKPQEQDTGTKPDNRIINET
jgi:predicted RND superfamily exporter protein